MRIFPTTVPAPTAAAGPGPSPSKSSGNLFGPHLASASQTTSTHPATDVAAHAHPSAGDAESSQATDATASPQTSSKDPQPASMQSAAVDSNSTPDTNSTPDSNSALDSNSTPGSSPGVLLPPTVVAALAQPATAFANQAAAALTPAGDPKSAPSQAGKSTKDGEQNSSQKAEVSQPATPATLQPAIAVPAPVLVLPGLLSIVVGGSIRDDRAQKAAAAPDLASLPADANSAKPAPQHTTAEGSPAIESAADAFRQQLSDAGAVQLPQENFTLPAVASSTPASPPSAPAAGPVAAATAPVTAPRVSAAPSGENSQKGSANLQATNSFSSMTSGLMSGLSTSGQKTDNSASSGTPAASSARPAAPSGAPPAQQGSASHAAAPQASGLVASTQPQPPVLHALTQDGSVPRSTVEGAGAGVAPRGADARGDALEHLADAAGRPIVTGIDSARLIQTMNQTEMRVGMHSADFGDISIRASLAQQQMMAQISVNHDELSQAMMTHLSTVQTKIGNDYGLQASISVHHQGTATAGQSGGQSYQQQQQPNTRSSRVINPAQLSAPEIMTRPMPAAAVDAEYRLDIQA